MAPKGRLSCFCTQAVAQRDKDEGRTSSKWVALSCGHIYHQACIDQWAQEKWNGGAEKNIYPCPYNCGGPQLYSIATDPSTGLPKKKLRVHYPYTLLYFEHDVESDPFDSSQMELSAYGAKAFGSPREKKRRRIASSSLGPSSEPAMADEIIIDDEEEDAAAAEVDPSESEVQRLRRELREALNSVRASAPGRVEAARLRQELESAKSELEIFKAVIEGLEADIAALNETAGTAAADDTIQGLQNRIKVLDASLFTAEEEIEMLREQVADLERQREEQKTEAHEVEIRTDATIRRLENKLKQAGTAGEEKIKQLKQEVETKDRKILQLQAEHDGIQYQADQKVKKAEAAAYQQIERAREDVKAAETAKTIAIEDAQRARTSEKRVKSSVATWEKKCNRLKAELAKRHKVIMDDDDLVAPPPAAAVTRSPAAPSPDRRQPLRPPPPADIYSDDDDLPAFKVKVTHKLSNPSPARAPGPSLAHKSSGSAILELSSDVDDDPAAEARMASLSPRKVSQSTSRLQISSGGFAGRKVELAHLKSDRHLPSFSGAGLKDAAGPKIKIKAVKSGRR